MRGSIYFSLGMHIAILLLAIVTFPKTRELPSLQTRALPVELLTVSEMTNLKRQAKKVAETKKPIITPSEKPVKEEPKPTPPAPKPEAKVEPVKSEPVEEEKAELIPDKTAEKVPEKKEPPKPVEKKPAKKTDTAKKPTKSFDPTNIAALLDKIPDKPKQEDVSETTEEKADAAQTDDPNNPVTLAVSDAFRAQMQKCWSIPAGAANAEELSVNISVYLNLDGSLARPPELTDRARLLTGGPYYRAAAEGVIRAIRRCEPYKLPADSYLGANGWNRLDLNFDPREMLGG
ncbi:MAG: hypothetical protein GC184_04630 [Rhizobiales bacterium]|nr:hypothetical protein [Hyphomicrobiales bacterium]